MPSEKSGWQADSIAKGSFALVRQHGKLNILFRDAGGEVRDTRGEGGEVFELMKTNEYLLVVAVHTSAVEHFMFRLDGQGFGEVAWGTARPSGMTQQSSLSTPAATASEERVRLSHSSRGNTGVGSGSGRSP